ncbi:energy transducer TonB [Shewanella surugensis]|uniref:TonB family protein n=1 Tax=Shewanella surugensis TaxID=212020 RepID=A0ABT0L9Z8_9GAMM|nr:energy transducer TonB [Shewanella surugensis]MCL1124534.1 TonB family protein [Shewanella surugensis]
MTSQRYALFASLNLLLLGSVLSQKNTQIPLSFSPSSGQAHTSHMSLTMASQVKNRQHQINDIIKESSISAAPIKKAIPIKSVIVKASPHQASTKSEPVKHQQTKRQRPLETTQPKKNIALTQEINVKQPKSSNNNKKSAENAENAENNVLETMSAQIKKTPDEQQSILHSMEITHPSFTSPPAQPRYPRLARKKGLEGIATLEVLFNQAGEQLSLTLISSSGFNLLDKAALDAVKQWHFSAPDEQIAYAYKVRVPVRFVLN